MVWSSRPVGGTSQCTGPRSTHPIPLQKATGPGLQLCLHLGLVRTDPFGEAHAPRSRPRLQVDLAADDGLANRNGLLRSDRQPVPLVADYGRDSLVVVIREDVDAGAGRQVLVVGSLGSTLPPARARSRRDAGDRGMDLAAYRVEEGVERGCRHRLVRTGLVAAAVRRLVLWWTRGGLGLRYRFPHPESRRALVAIDDALCNQWLGRTAGSWPCLLSPAPPESTPVGDSC